MVDALFLCFGNICRSPLAEYVFRDLVSRAGLSDRITCRSRGTSTMHSGEGMDVRSLHQLEIHGIDGSGHVSRPLEKEDFISSDLVLVMDSSNMSFAKRMRPEGCGCRIAYLKEPVGGGDVADPWYTGRFDETYDEVLECCERWLDEVSRGLGL